MVRDEPQKIFYTNIYCSKFLGREKYSNYGIVPYHIFSEMYFEKTHMLEQEYLQAMDDPFGR